MTVGFELIPSGLGPNHELHTTIIQLNNICTVFSRWTGPDDGPGFSDKNFCPYELAGDEKCSKYMLSD